LPANENQHALLRGRVENESRRASEDLSHDLQVERRFIVRGRDENRLPGQGLQPPIGVVIQIRKKDPSIVRPGIPGDGLDQGRAAGALPLHPFVLVGLGMGVGEDPLRIAVEGLDVARIVHVEPFDRDAVDDRIPLGIFRGPGDVILGRRGVDGADVPSGDEALGDHLAMDFGAAHDFGPVALNDEGNLHEALSPVPGRRPSGTTRGGTI
jgi:hypothetical protein